MFNDPQPRSCAILSPPGRKPRLPRELSQRRPQLPPDGWYRDLVVAMQHPFVVLSSKREGRRTPGVTFKESKRGFFVRATAFDAATGVATIDDWDIVIFATSKLVEAFNGPGEQSLRTLNPTISFRPRDLLAAIRRPEVKGSAPIERLGAALQRLMNTRILLLRRGEEDREFTLLQTYHRGRATTDDPHPSWSLTVPRWMLEEITRPGGPFVAQINPAYFDLGGSPLLRVVARWAVAYRRYEPGPPVSIRLVRAYKLSGMNGWSRFYGRLDEIVAADPLPDHTLKLANADREDGGELVIDVRPGKARKSRTPLGTPTAPKHPAGMSAAPERGLLDNQIEGIGSPIELWL